MARASYEFVEIGVHDTDLLTEWYRLYRASFPHRDEQEPLEFFRQILVMDENPDLQKRFGPYREFVLALRDSQTKEIVAGLNFGVTTSDAHRAAGIAASAHVVFLFIAPEYRSQLQVTKQFRAAMNERAYKALACWNLPTKGSICLFFEVNNPLDMSPEDILSDHANSGTDTFHRYVGWLMIGWPLDFAYVQPALSAEKGPVEFLQLFYDGPGKRKSVPSEVIWHHLFSFISFSVLKGSDARLNPEFHRMEEFLHARREVAFIPADSPDIAAIRQEEEARRAMTRAAQAVEKPFPFPDKSAAFARPGPLRNAYIVVMNRIYRTCHWLFTRFEPHHVLMAWIELGALFLAFTVALAEQYAFVRNHMSPELVERFPVRLLEILVFAFLFIYLGTRMWVQRRRNHLGPSLHAIEKEMRRRRSAAEGGNEPAYEWLQNALVEGARMLSASGYLVNAPVPMDTRDSRLQRMAQFGAPFYSERILGGQDYRFAEREYIRLKTALEHFPEGLWCAGFTNCPDHVFASLILPIQLPTAQTSFDLEALRADVPRARLLAGRRGRGEGPPDGVPCLLILRQLPSTQLAGAKPSRPIDQQVDLLLTTLLHLSDMLARLSPGGDILQGLQDVSVLCVASTPTTRWLLEHYGFKLLQDPSPRHEKPATEDDGAAFAIYSLAVRQGVPRDSGTQRFLRLLTLIHRARYSKAVPTLQIAA